jgi:Erv1 / Alr family
MKNKHKRKQKSQNTMHPNFFIAIWDTMYLLARALPFELDDLQKNTFIEFIKGLLPALPCPNCKMHAMNYYMDHNLNYIRTGQEAVEWVVSFHNSVNMLNGKRTYTVQEAAAAFEARYIRPIIDASLTNQ